MPIYEYECKFCSHRFQLLQKVSEPQPEKCPNCHKEGGIHKLISETSFSLKGSGWYATDYKSAAAAKTKKTNSSKEENNK